MELNVAVLTILLLQAFSGHSPPSWWSLPAPAAKGQTNDLSVHRRPHRSQVQACAVPHWIVSDKDGFLRMAFLNFGNLCRKDIL